MQRKKPVLFTYVVRHDTGAAPNPFWGMCTLVICKPQIRRAAQIGDWVVGTGSRRSPAGDLSGCVVFAMQVTDQMTMQEYDAWTRQHLPNKVPDRYSPDPARRLGDSIYDFSFSPPSVRPSAHDVTYRDHDLGGEYALISKRFWYFGDQAIKLPPELEPIAKRGPGHRSVSKADYAEEFIAWINGLSLEPNRLYGRPQEKRFEDMDGIPIEGCGSC